MKTRLKLLFKREIQFEEAYSIEEKSERKVQYADCRGAEAAVLDQYPPKPVPVEFTNVFEDDAIPDEALTKKHSPKTHRK